MFVSLAVSAIFGIICVSAQAGAGYGTDSYADNGYHHGGYGNDPYGRGYGGGGYNYYDYYNALNSLDAIDERLDRLEGREVIQEELLQDLVASANANLNFRNKYNTYYSAQIEFRRNQQNKQLDDLTYQVERIAALRAQVAELHVEADNSREILESQILDGQRDAISRIEGLRNDALADDLKINVAQQQARDITHGIDLGFFKILRNKVDLDMLYRALKAVISAVNRQRSAHVWHRLTPEYPDYSVEFQPPFDGPPQAAFRNIVGSKHERSSYSYDYESLYYGFTSKLWNNRDDISLVDMSTGGWSVPELDYNGDYIYFHDCKLEKSLLPAPRDD